MVITQKCCKQYPAKQYLYGHLPSFIKTIEVRQTRHERHCWSSWDELISDILLWTPSHGRAKTRRPARTYIQQLSADTGCSLEDLPGAMDDREGWRERVKEIRTGGAIYIYIYIYIYHGFLISIYLSMFTLIYLSLYALIYRSIYRSIYL